MSPRTGTPRTVLGALVPSFRSPDSDTHPVRDPFREGRFPHDLAIWERPEATGRSPTISLVDREPRTLAPFPASQIAPRTLPKPEGVLSNRTAQA